MRRCGSTSTRRASTPERFAAHERFFVEDVRRWVRSRFGVALPAERTAVCGVSAGGELALAMGLRHPDVYGAVFSASPGGGYRPPAVMPSPLPRTYLVAGTLEPFFLENATRWAAALRDAGADVVMTERVGDARRRVLARRVPADGRVGVRTMTPSRNARSCHWPRARKGDPFRRERAHLDDGSRWTSVVCADSDALRLA